MNTVKRTVMLTAKEVKALERAWEVLHYGYVADAHNGYDPMKRNHKRDQRQAEIIHELLGDPEKDQPEDWSDRFD